MALSFSALRSITSTITKFTKEVGNLLTEANRDRRLQGFDQRVVQFESVTDDFSNWIYELAPFESAYAIASFANDRPKPSRSS